MPSRTVGVAADHTGLLVLAGAFLFLFAIGTMVAIAAALRGLPEGRRALEIQGVTLAAFAVSGGTRAYLLLGASPMDVRASIVLGALDAFLAGLFWWSLTLLRGLLEGGFAGARRWSPWPTVAVAGFVYLGASTTFPSLTAAPLEAIAQGTGVLVVGAWGLAMVQLYRMLVLVERPLAGALALLSLPTLALPIYASTVITSWLGLDGMGGIGATTIAAAGVPATGLLAVAAALALFAAVHRADVASEVTRAVLRAALSPRENASPQASAPLARDSHDLVHGFLDGNAQAEGAHAPGLCRVCNRPIDGLEYHHHDLPGVAGPSARDVGRVVDAYATRTEEERAALLARK